MLLAISAGCFTEPAESEPGSPTCDPGSFGCECLGGVCEPDLECTSTNVCIPEGCTPGTAVCECDAQGECGPMLECMGNVCFPPGGTSAGPETETAAASSTSTTSSTDATSKTSTVTTNPDDTSTTEQPDSSTTGGPTGPSETTDSPDECDVSDGKTTKMSCQTCFSCTNTADCATEHDNCEQVGTCLQVAGCLADCSITSVCFTECCSGFDEEAVAAATLLDSCRRDACSGPACPQFSPQTCNP